MKILLTGSNGFLGKILKTQLSIDNELSTLAKSNSDYNVDLLFDFEFEDNFDLVIHAAGKAHSVPKTTQEGNLFYDINVQGTINLLDRLIKVGAPKQFVFISSVSVYGLNGGNLINEYMPLLAQDPYGLSKIEAEKIVKDWCKKHNVIYTIFRLPLVAGPNPPGNLGAMILGIKKGYYFNIAGGEAKKSMVLASDIANSIINAAKVGGTYNLTDGYHPNFNELSKNISSQLRKAYILNMPYFVAKMLANVGDIIGHKFPINTNKLFKITSSLTFDDSKARKAFGWNPTPILKGFKIKEHV